ncbi:pyridoxal phosphate-dependent decarboxylase family protein [Nocardioides renjunii]|uniref:pyridoxal phosphate-dependent decarboxylase family protein n=1 Tax=Nocardioides renjunii TaxID=3095075 RepID=UPI002AFFC9E3|nr:pyridoxal-dependent decarboxylase [Nocardioides sp. S-34]WQQ20570.1 pyridoxal-dependent decarboxylase [Nocardioides sp. S-34]
MPEESTDQPSDAITGHMSPEEFRRQGHAAIDWIADYWASLDDLPVRAQVAPGDVRHLLPASAPEDGEPFDAVLADLDRVVVPGLTHWQHPRFFAYFPANSSPAAILGDLLSSGIGAQGMIWATSPAVTEVEQVVLDWLAEALGLPVAFRSDGPGGGVIQDTASTATFTALLSALHRASGGEARRHGVGGAGWRVYGSTQAHSSLVKAAIMAGLGEDAVRTVAVDPATQAMDVNTLHDAVVEDVGAGLRPLLVHVAAGSTSTGAMDDIAAVAEAVRPWGVWVHVDAAWAGVAAVCPEHREHLAGVEAADSFVTNPHKWLLTTFDCSTFWVRDRAALTGALSILPEYLRNAATESGEVVDYRDWHPQLGRRFRAVKLWAVLRTYGLNGLRAHIRSGVDLADHVAGLVAADERFELVTEPALSLVVFRLRAGDEATMAAMEAVNASGEAYLSHTTVEGRAAIRLAVGSWRTTRADVERTWRALQEAAAAQA